MVEDFQNLSATELAAGLRSAKWTSVELTEFFLDRIKTENPKVHAVPIVCAEEALRDARSADQRQKAGKPLSAIDGLPMTMKDAIRVKDMRSTYGLWFLHNYRPTNDSKVTRTLRESGVVFLGRTAVPTAAMDWNCKNQVYAECVNPFDPKISPGGSSGGAAAALAMNMTPLEVGSDLGGSIRYPAHCCGIYGLRTTDGWLPIDDVGPEAFSTTYSQLVALGPMARNLEDLDLLLERFAADYPFAKKFSPPAPGPLKIAYSPSLSGIPADSATREAFQEVLRKLRSQGHTLIEANPYPDTEELYRLWGMIAGYQYASALPPIARNRIIKSIHAWMILDHRLGPGPFNDRLKAGMFASEQDFQTALAKRETVLKATDQFFEEHHVWILPVAPSSAIPLVLSGKEIPTENGTFTYTEYLGAYTVPPVTLGTPALACPMGKDRAGLPIGVQIHGPRFSDLWLVKSANELMK